MIYNIIYIYTQESIKNNKNSPQHFTTPCDRKPSDALNVRIPRPAQPPTPPPPPNPKKAGVFFKEKSRRIPVEKQDTSCVKFTSS